MKKSSLLALAFICITLKPCITLADDSFIGIVGGSAQNIEKHQTIQMTEEYVRMDVSSQTYTVKAHFRFYNNGASTAVLVGFPAMPKALKQDFLSFKTFVNAKSAEFTDYPPDHAKNTTRNILGDQIPEHYYKVKQVSFPAHSTTTTSVEYIAPLGSRAPNLKWALYVFGTGRTWNGPIGKAIFDINFDESSLISSYDKMEFFSIDNASPKIIHRSNGQIVFGIDNLIPKLETDGIQIDFTYLKDFLPDCPSGWKCDKARYEFADLFGDNDRRKLSLMQLRLLRNWIYAKHGLVFKDPFLQNVFNKLAWYTPSRTQENIDLSDNEKTELKQISELESAIKKSDRYIPPDFVTTSESFRE